MKAAARLVKEAIVHRRYERALEDESAYAIISVWDYIKVSRLVLLFYHSLLYYRLSPLFKDFSHSRLEVTYVVAVSRAGSILHISTLTAQYIDSIPTMTRPKKMMYR